MKRFQMFQHAVRRVGAAPLSGGGGAARKQPIRTTRRALERTTLSILLMLAWGWIMVTFGMVFYHGYYKKPTSIRIPAQQQQRQIIASNEDREHRPKPQIAPLSSSSSSSSFLLVPHASPLLIFTCSRPAYLEETLETIQKYVPRDCSVGCPIVVSQDGNKPDVKQVIDKYRTIFAAVNIPVVHLQHASALRGGVNAYQALAVHYGWALRQVFDGKAVAEGTTTTATHPVQPSRVIILEEDIRIAPDFFDYFGATVPVLESDTTLLAVSAFNDNGYAGKVMDATRILRSDFFPGLGWCMTRRLWKNELETKWPGGYWDDWLREPAQRKGRQVLRPEMSRTFHFGSKGGTSGNQFGNRLSAIQLNTIKVDWKHTSVAHLQRDRFDYEYWRILRAARRVDTVQEGLERSKSEHVRLDYDNFKEFQASARQLQLMDDEKAGIPRTAYKGVVETRPHGKFLFFLTPPMQHLQREFENVI